MCHVLAENTQELHIVDGSQVCRIFDWFDFWFNHMPKQADPNMYLKLVEYLTGLIFKFRMKIHF